MERLKQNGAIRRRSTAITGREVCQGNQTLLYTNCSGDFLLDDVVICYNCVELCLC